MSPGSSEQSRKLALAYAKGIGGTRGGVIETRVVCLEHRHDRDDDIRQCDHGMADDEPHGRTHEADLRRLLAPNL